MSYMLSNAHNLTTIDLSHLSFAKTKDDPQSKLVDYLKGSPLSKITLGKDTVLTASGLNDVPTDDTYTGKWINVNDKDDTPTTAELIAKYDGSGKDSTATTYIWQKIKPDEPDKPTVDPKPNENHGSNHSSSSDNNAPIEKDVNLTVGTFSDKPTVKLYTKSGDLVNDRALTPDSFWKVNQVLIKKDSDGTNSQYFRVANNEYIKINDGYVYNENHDVIFTNDLTKLYNSHGKLVTDRVLAKNTNWSIDKKSTDILESSQGSLVANNGDSNGPLMYRVATNEWVRASDINI